MVNLTKTVTKLSVMLHNVQMDKLVNPSRGPAVELTVLTKVLIKVCLRFVMYFLCQSVNMCCLEQLHYTKILDQFCGVTVLDLKRLIQGF